MSNIQMHFFCEDLYYFSLKSSFSWIYQALTLDLNYFCSKIVPDNSCDNRNSEEMIQIHLEELIPDVTNECVCWGGLWH